MYNIGGLALFASAAYKTVYAQAYAEVLTMFDAQRAIFENLYVEIDTLDTSINKSYLSAPPAMVPMRASHPQAGGAEVGAAVAKIPYKSHMTIERDLLESTNGAALATKVLKDMAITSSRFKMDLVNDLILGNAVGDDGVTFFNATHPAFEGSGIQSNLAGTAFAAGAGYVTELPNFLALLDSGGRVMGQIPDTILVSPTLYPAAMIYFNPNRVAFDMSGTAAASLPVSPIENVGFVYTTANNAVTATEWFMFNARTVKPFLFVQTEDPVIESSPVDSEDMRIQRQMNIVTSWFGRAAFGPWWTSYQSNV